VTTTRERLEQLEQADFDSFGEQDMGAGEHPLVTPEEVEEIRKALHDAPWLDPARYPECLETAFEALATIAVLDSPAAYDASQALRWIMQRVVLAAPTPSAPRGELA
jgi:hypothetical protein